MLPLVMDRETTAQEKCLQILDEVILQNIVPRNTSQTGDHQLAWKLVQIVAGPLGQELMYV